MSAGEMIVAVIVFAVAGVMLLLSVRSFQERGVLLNNAWLYASEKQRKTMNKKPYYRQSAIVFCFLSLVFIVCGLSVVLKNSRIVLLEIPVIAGVVIYAIVSTVQIQKREMK